MKPLLIFHSLHGGGNAIHERVRLDLHKHNLQWIQGNAVIEMLALGAQP